jgi:hypothetical protein
MESFMRNSPTPPPTANDFAKESPGMAAKLASLRSRINFRKVIVSGNDIKPDQAQAVHCA